MRTAIGLSDPTSRRRGHLRAARRTAQGQSRPIILDAGGVIFKQVPAVDARRQQCITL
jgi:hypothetical protein